MLVHNHTINLRLVTLVTATACSLVSATELFLTGGGWQTGHDGENKSG